MELQFVFPVEPFLTERAGEGLLSRVYQHVSAEVVRLFEGSATLPAAVLPLTLRVKLHRGAALSVSKHQAALRRLRRSHAEIQLGLLILILVAVAAAPIAGRVSLRTEEYTL